jgi:hypothetical protein
MKADCLRDLIGKNLNLKAGEDVASNSDENQRKFRSNTKNYSGETQLSKQVEEGWINIFEYVYCHL